MPGTMLDVEIWHGSENTSHPQMAQSLVGQTDRVDQISERV